MDKKAIQFSKTVTINKRKTLNTRDITSYLKGFAIGAVLINHYVNCYLSNAYNEYANGIIALFFILSGYGIFYSLSKYNEINVRTLLKYLYNRSIRIYPLFWLSLLLMGLDSHERYPLKTFIAIPLFQAPDIYWFITSLIQCYLVAPLLYLIVKRFGPIKYIIAISFFMLLVYVFYPFTSLPYNRELFVYRYLFLGHIFLFALGMVLPSIIAKHQLKFDNTILVFISFLIFLILVYYTRKANILFSHSAIYIAPLFIISALTFCLYVISTDPLLPFNRLVVLIGSYSYSIYLFHLIFYKILSKFGLIKYGSLQGIIFTLLLFPIFCFSCAIAEKSINKLSSKIQINRTLWNRLAKRGASIK